MKLFHCTLLVLLVELHSGVSLAGEASHYQAGLQAKRAKNYSRAIAEFQKAIAANPRDASSHSALGWTFAASGDRKQAVAALEAASKLAGDTPQAKIDAEAARRLREALGMPTSSEYAAKGKSTGPERRLAATKAENLTPKPGEQRAPASDESSRPGEAGTPKAKLRKSEKVRVDSSRTPTLTSDEADHRWGRQFGLFVIGVMATVTMICIIARVRQAKRDRLAALAAAREREQKEAEARARARMENSLHSHSVQSSGSSLGTKY